MVNTSNMVGTNLQTFQSPPRFNEAGLSITPSDASLGDSTNGGTIVADVAPYPAGDWPDEWGALLDSIRVAPYVLAWDLFAGSQSVTHALSHRVWTCAPPVGVLVSQWFNLLNPLFLSIIVGIILEGRITLLVLDPPLGGPPLECNRIGDVASTISSAIFRTGGHVIWFGGGLDRLDLPYRIHVSSCQFGTPWCQMVSFSSSWDGILHLGACCKDRCGLRKENGNNSIWPLLAESLAKCVDGLVGIIVAPKCAHIWAQSG